MNVNYFNKMSRNRYETMIYYCLHGGRGGGRYTMYYINTRSDRDKLI